MRRRQRGQAILVILVFLAAFLVVIWAGLTLASAAFLGLSRAQDDTRTTYALDAGVAYGLELVKLSRGCAVINRPPFTLAYPTGDITVTVAITPEPGCNNTAYTLRVTASGTSRVARAYVDQSQNGNGNGLNPFQIVWELYQ